MSNLVSERLDQPWLRRLYLPSYQIAEAANYAGITPQTVAAWHKFEKEILTRKAEKAALSYLQLIELAVVAAFRKMGVSFKTIRATRDYAKNYLKKEYPFATYRFKEEARHLFLDSNEIEGLPVGRLVELGLTVKSKTAKSNDEQKSRAREMAGEAIDVMTDDAANADDQASRKRRLLKGPEEFRDVRTDRAKRK